MGLLTIIKKVKQQEKEMRLLILGLDNAGKTTILRKFNNESIDTICPTVGFNIKTLEFNGCKLNIWDVGGQSTIRPYWRNYYEETDGLLWVVDSADKRRLNDCKNELQNLLLEEKLAGASLLIFINKQDLETALPKKEIEELLELKNIKGRHINVVSCSAVTGEGLVEGMTWIQQDIQKRIFLFE